MVVNYIEQYQPSILSPDDRQWQVIRAIIEAFADNKAAACTPWASVQDASNVELNRLLTDSSAMGELCDAQVEGQFEYGKLVQSPFTLRDYQDDVWVRQTVRNYFADKAVEAIARQAVSRLVAMDAEDRSTPDPVAKA